MDFVRLLPDLRRALGWTSLEPLDRKGVNMRLFDPEELVGVPIRFPNSREWNDVDERPAPRHGEVPFARDAPF